MPAPTQVVTWDSTQANLVPTTSGHQADGWALSEDPTSTEMNGWMYAVAVWIVYLATLPRPAAWEWSLAIQPTFPTGPLAASGVSYSSSTCVATLAAGAQFAIPIYPKVGETITSLGAVNAYVSGHSPGGINLTLEYSDPSTGAVDTAGTVSLSNASSSLVKQTGTLGTPHVVLDGAAYWILVTNPNGVFSCVMEMTTAGYQASFNV